MFTVVLSGQRDTSREEAVLAAELGPLQIKCPGLPGPQQLVELFACADAAIVGAVEQINAEVLARAGRCRIITRYGVGTDNVDIAAATARGILVACVPDASVAEVADHTAALVLSLARAVVPLNQAIHAGIWSERGVAALRPLRSGLRRLSTGTLGLVGFGRIGRAVWQRLRGFGLAGCAYDPGLAPAVIQAEGVDPCGLDELLARADFVSLHLPLSDQTRHLLSAAALAMMKPSAFLINTSRGGLIDEAALVAALNAGRLAGAGLDVTETEPPGQGSPLVGHPRVLLTGHSAYYSLDSQDELSRRAAEITARALQGEVPPEVVNPAAVRR